MGEILIVFKWLFIVVVVVVVLASLGFFLLGMFQGLSGQAAETKNAEDNDNQP